MITIRPLKPGEYIINCRTEDELMDILSDFESYLLTKGLKPFVQIGRANMQRLFFDFRINTTDQEEIDEVFAFFKPFTSYIDSSSDYRIRVVNGSKEHVYPFNDIKTALILYHVLQFETNPATEVLLERQKMNRNGWVEWRDKEKRTASERQLVLINGVIDIAE